METTFFEKGNVKVTGDQLITEDNAYNIHDISSVAIGKRPARIAEVIDAKKQQRGRSRVLTGILLAVISASMITIFAGGDGGATTLLVIGFALLGAVGMVLLLLGILDAMTASGTDHIPSEFQLLIKTPDGEKSVVELPELESVEVIRDAINAAKEKQ